jgi:hypothetical protein
MTYIMAFVDVTSASDFRCLFAIQMPFSFGKQANTKTVRSQAL